MCLAIPGLVEQIFHSSGLTMAKVNFGGIKKTTCLEYTPQAQVGNYVLVHVGFAISVIDEEEADRTLKLLSREGDAIKELTEPFNYSKSD